MCHPVSTVPPNFARLQFHSLLNTHHYFTEAKWLPNAYTLTTRYGLQIVSYRQPKLALKPGGGMPKDKKGRSRRCTWNRGI
jgi:hypothetical protein